ncbi:MAG: hypothetical protein NTZ70_01275 [Methylococcales bacterium]|nr:hypothetical protein [Methylococcales bacterium]
MDLLLAVASGIAIIFGIFVFFAGGIGNILGGSIAMFSGMYAYDTKTFMPIVVGYFLLWILRLLGFDKS